MDHVVEKSRVRELSRAPAITKVPRQEYEHLVWPYVLALPFMNGIAFYAHMKKIVLGWFDMKPRVNCWLGDGLTASGRRVRDGAKTWRALDTVYNFKEGKGPNAIARLIDTFYMHIRSAQAPRNRLKMAKETLWDAALHIRSERDSTLANEPVRILSLAAGSAQGVIEVMDGLRKQGIRCEAFLVDTDPTAIAHARTLANTHGLSDSLQAVVGDVFRFKKLIGDFQPDIVEMMGLTDYLEDRQAVVLFKLIRMRLHRGGYFFTSNVHPNPERYFLEQVVNWGDMIYRTKHDLKNLLAEAGFLDPKVVPEPHGFQSFVYDRRTD